MSAPKMLTDLADLVDLARRFDADRRHLRSVAFRLLDRLSPAQRVAFTADPGRLRRAALALPVWPSQEHHSPGGYQGHNGEHHAH